ncbi:hypothetical protein ACFV30_25835 [Streptomyces sp. NPDC059752]|uniref:hypothetical protein n=1 Tax=unclassified Streptomyces TaxID=2593676 RepID=UPI00364B7C02
MKNRLIAAVGGFALAAASLTLATPAVAATSGPSGDMGKCDAWKTHTAPWGGSAKCTGTARADKFRVELTCIDSRGSQYTVLGPWKKNDQTSSAVCSSDPNVGVLHVSVIQSA